MARADAKYSVTLEDKTQRALRQIQGNLGRVQSGFATLGKAAAVLGGVSGGGFLLLTRRTLDNADAMIKQADAAGLSSDAFQEYSDALSFAGISQETFNTATIAFVKRVGEARNGVGPLVSGLKGLNQELLDGILAARNQDEALDLVFQAMGNAATAADRARIANAAFSRTGVTMARAVKDGAEGLQDLRRQARESGRVIEEGLLRNAEAANDAMARLQRTVGANMSRALLQNADAIEELGNQFANALPKIIDGARVLGEFIGIIDKSDRQKAIESLSAIGVEIGRVATDIADLDGDVNALTARLGRVRVEGMPIFERLQSLRLELSELQSARADLERQLSGGPLSIGVTGGTELPTDDPAAAERERQAALTEAARVGARERFMIEANFAAASVVRATEAAQQQIAIEQEAAQRRAQTEADVQSQIMQYQSMTAANFGEVQSYLSAKSKDWARAFVLINKGAALAAAIANRGLAITKAYTVDPTGVLAGKVAMASNIAIASIIASGAAQLASINESGPGGGPAASGGALNPINTNPVQPIGQPQGSERQLTIVIDTGGSGLAVMSERQLDDIIVDAVQRADDRGVTIIRPNGSNAQAVRSGF